MARQLYELKSDIMLGKLSAQEWLILEEEVAEAMKVATENEIQDFADSGAGEALYMTCSALRIVEEKTNN